MRILADESAAVIIDLQERLFPHIHDHERLLENCRILISGLQILSIPLIVTEQYSKGLGTTIGPIKNTLSDYQPLEKTSFSCCDLDSFMQQLNRFKRKYIIICGIEAHVCVMQTALDMLSKEYQPVLVEDCVSSRKFNDKQLAVERMRQAGVIVTSYESILFELCRVSGTEQFKTISKLVK